ncbi:hypothetical protein Ancab_033969 [Ancistrocladus abbreviatus]
MEKKQLNFSMPLLSARRYSSTLRSSSEDKTISLSKKRNMLPSQKSTDMVLDEVVKPGSVPFIWERVPGKAKVGRELQHQNSEEPSSTTKLPPGRPMEVIPRTSGKKSGEQKSLRPQNKQSGELKIPRAQNKYSGELIVSRPGNKLLGQSKVLRPQNKLSGEINVFRPQSRRSSSHNTSVARRESLREVILQNSDSDPENGDATYSDALDTFSQLESLSINNCVSGLSGSESPMKRPPGTFPTDVQTQDFMMKRFLPAAKAMTLDSPQCTSRRQLMAVEQSCEVKALVPQAMGPLPPQNVSKIIPYSSQVIGLEETEDGDEDDSCDMPNNVSVKACGFLPWFCSKKKSLCMLNLVPAIKLKTRSALSSVSKIGRLVKTGSYSSSSQSLGKQSPGATQKHRLNSGLKMSELHHTDSKAKSKSKPMFSSGELHGRNSLSPYRNCRRSGVSPCRNESHHSLHHMGEGFLAVPKMVRQVDDYGPKEPQEPPSQQRNTRQSASGSPLIEKTLYIETASTTKVLQASSTLHKTKRPVDSSRRNASTVVGNSSSNYGGYLDIMKARGISKHWPSDDGGQVVMTDNSILDQSSDMKPKSSGGTRMLTDRNICGELVVTADDQCPFPPPLPKSPSDSWLSRNLASGSPRNSYSYSNHGNKPQPRKQNTKAPISSTKWETIVKSSHLCHNHGCYSEEPVTHVSQQHLTRK